MRWKVSDSSDSGLLERILDLVTFACFFLGLIGGGASSFFLAKHIYEAERDAANQNAAVAEAEALRLNSELGQLRAEHLSIVKLAKEREARIETLTLALQAESAQLEVERRRSVELARETTHLQERLAVAQAQMDRFGQWASRYPPTSIGGGELTLIGGSPRSQHPPDFLSPQANEVTMTTPVWIALLSLSGAATVFAFVAGRRTGSRRR
jgi:hypothetical protein